MCGLRLGKNFVMLLQHWSGAVMRLAFFSATLRIYNSFLPRPYAINKAGGHY